MATVVGTAGWTVPRDVADQFPSSGTALQRYAARFAGTEINSSFHRSHRLSTWERWRDSVPDEFRFSVKVSKQITHGRKLVDCEEELARFIEEAAALREKLAVLRVQLPPKLAFDHDVARPFFERMAAQSPAAIACEPRHPSWFSDEVDQFLTDLRAARVAADPSICESAARPGGWPGLRYWRLHGSPVVYRSSYGERVNDYAAQMARYGEGGADQWCIFDNTASSAATRDALALMEASALR